MLNRILFISFSLYLILPHQSFAAESEFFGYARAGVGISTLGGDQECFYNQGSGGWGGIGRNEARLGNECSNYLELGLKIHHLKSGSQGAFTQIRLSNSHNGSDLTENSSQSTQVVELYSEIYGIEEVPFSSWIGKRYYRDQDVHIDDFYYFGAMNGNGAGIENYKMFDADFSMALLRRVSDSKSWNMDAQKVDQDPLTDKGRPTQTVLDFRLKNLNLSADSQLNFWTAIGYAPESTNKTTGVHYGQVHGGLVGVLWAKNYQDIGFLHLAAMFGNGLMNEFNMYGGTTVALGNDQDSLMKKNRLRLVEHITTKLSSTWQTHASVAYESLMSDGSEKNSWASITLRPQQIISDHFQINYEVGMSEVSESGKDTRSLQRFTIAPQLSVSSNIWGRPVLRMYVTHSQWNDANKTYVSQNAPSFADKNSGGAFGFQVEAFL